MLPGYVTLYAPAVRAWPAHLDPPAFSIKKVLKKVEKAFRPVIKTVVPAAVGIIPGVGTILGPGLSSAIQARDAAKAGRDVTGQVNVQAAATQADSNRWKEWLDAILGVEARRLEQTDTGQRLKNQTINQKLGEFIRSPAGIVSLLGVIFMAVLVFRRT